MTREWPTGGGQRAAAGARSPAKSPAGIDNVFISEIHYPISCRMASRFGVLLLYDTIINDEHQLFPPIIVRHDSTHELVKQGHCKSGIPVIWTPDHAF